MTTMFEESFKQLFHRVGPHCVKDSEVGGWGVSPYLHVTEGPLSVLVGIIGMWVGYRRFRRSLQQTLKELNVDIRQKKVVSRSATIVNRIMFFILVVSISIICIHKYTGNKLPFLIQPCHMIHTFLIIIFLLPSDTPDSLGSICFSIYLHLLFAPFLGLVAADMSCYKQFFELENWFIQHVMLLLVPCVWIYQRRFDVYYKGLNFFLFSFNILMIYHFGVLLSGSLLTGSNLNFMLCPPAPLRMFGQYYRTPTSIGSVILCLLVRYVTIELLIRCLHRPNAGQVEPADSIQKLKQINEQSSENVSSLSQTETLKHRKVQQKTD